MNIWMDVLAFIVDRGSLFAAACVKLLRIAFLVLMLLLIISLLFDDFQLFTAVVHHLVLPDAITPIDVSEIVSLCKSDRLVSAVYEHLAVGLMAVVAAAHFILVLR